MSYKDLHKHSLEILEARIAPAGVVSVLPKDPNAYVKANFGGPIELHAGQVLTTTNNGQVSGEYLLYLEKGNALVFMTDLNLNGLIDYNEITGIAAGNGMRLVSFVDIHGDIVTNLKEQTVYYPNGSSALQLSLSDSDYNSGNDSSYTRGDGRVLLNNTIEKIELRTLRVSDIAVDQNADGKIDATDVAERAPLTSFSIYGNIYAGRGFGALDGGLMIDTDGAELDVPPQVGFIKTGSAVSGEFYSFGVTRSINDSNGIMARFTPASGQAGADIIGVKATDFSAEEVSSTSTTPFNIDGLIAGKGGAGARGGNIVNVSLNGDDFGGYQVIAGDGGRGTVGGAGGSITNFGDVGSNSSRIIIQSGTGGVATTGGGGNAGDLSFATLSVSGLVDIRAGNGGAGFSSGGNGASIVSGDISGFSSSTVGGTGMGTTHVPDASSGVYEARIGRTDAIDFDQDGYGDFVYTTTGSSQLAVMFGGSLVTTDGFRDELDSQGNPTGYKDRIYLSGARNATAMTVADLNGDGLLDIAVASNDEEARGGITVFLGRFEHEGMGALSAAEDLNHNGVNDFTFRAGRHSVLPQLSTVTPSNDPIQVTSMVAGDFSGAGYTELAIVASGTVMFLTPDLENDEFGVPKATGQYYADFGALAVASPATAAIKLTPYVGIAAGADAFSEDGPATVLIEATALSNGAGHDVLLVAKFGSVSISTYDYSTRTTLSPSPTSTGSFDGGVVDVDRLYTVLDDPLTLDVDEYEDHSDLVPFKVWGFAAADFDADGIADVGAVTTIEGAGFFVGIKGVGTGHGDQISTDGSVDDPGDNAGNYFGTVALAIRAADIDGDAALDDFIICGAGGVLWGAGAEGASNLAGWGGGTTLSGSGVFFDVYHHDISVTLPANGTKVPSSVRLTSETDISFAGADPFAVTQTITEISLGIYAGDGGASSVGGGGAGGSLGGIAKLVSTTNATTGVLTKTYKGALNLTAGQQVDLYAGNGGDGFTSGGVGGKVTGVVSTSGSLTVTAGDGGRGFSLAGGNGGDIAANMLKGATDYIAGDGGSGVTGGAGGSIIGNNTLSALFPDTIADDLTLTAGNGGAGRKTGGKGGSILQFHPELKSGGALTYLAGNGGTAISGVGGDGGSITDSVPQVNASVDGGIFMTAGNGGHGASGGAGGSISNFILSVSSSSGGAAAFEIMAGHGGAGDSGVGGVGGSVTGFTASGSGTGGTLNKLLGGNGGASAGSRGGAGGSVQTVNIGLNKGSVVFAAGAGGSGLTYGGAGGDVSSVIANIPGLAKALVIAGAGGNASAFIPNLNDSVGNQATDARNSYGGVIGVGGRGGSISGFSQSSQSSAHYDLIAGNGGSTLNYGNLFDTKSYVGNGGSILNIDVKGDLGNCDPNADILSYNDLSMGESMADFVNNKVRALDVEITDADGNVGIVVGAAGRSKSRPASIADETVYTTLPSQAAVNGSLSNIGAANILAAVAGNVELIAAIQTVTNIKVATNSGTVGVDKNTLGTSEFLDTLGAPSLVVVLGGALIDGAMVAHNYVGTKPTGVVLTY